MFTNLFTDEWWKYTFYLMTRAGAQSLLAAITADQLGWFTQWYQIGATVLTFMVMSFLTSILSSPVPKRPDDSDV